ncbi:ERAD-associated E3 ubiquitin-protein ligase HRD1A-like [Andrographis paniculata]|uniref:ERAD-associated E3 ubiquitin-protein ligase HRD1A-like n=1 Tax=Andrographis paniculata TaxID=175694 RepID=UPI0021E8F0E0|nr:ERAD-associated E3 ubiquitin-protein ligase HRD1A-like [Andrographis paniculata]
MEINNDQEMSTASNLFEYLMGRRYESYDSDRIRDRIVREIVLINNSERDSALTRDDLIDAIHFAIEEEIAYLRDSRGGFSADWTPANEQALFSAIICLIRVVFSNMIENLMYELNLILEEDPRQHNDDLSDKTIDGYLKERNFSGVAAPNEETQLCIVCRDDLRKEVETKEIARLECGHLYHVYCIKKWLRLKNTCPLCRAICVNL